MLHPQELGQCKEVTKYSHFADEETLSKRRQIVQYYASQAVGGGDSKESQVSQLQSPGLQLCSTQKLRHPSKVYKTYNRDHTL